QKCTHPILAPIRSSALDDWRQVIVNRAEIYGPGPLSPSDHGVLREQHTRLGCSRFRVVGVARTANTSRIHHKAATGRHSALYVTVTAEDERRLDALQPLRDRCLRRECEPSANIVFQKVCTIVV